MFSSRTQFVWRFPLYTSHILFTWIWFSSGCFQTTTHMETKESLWPYVVQWIAHMQHLSLGSWGGIDVVTYNFMKEFRLRDSDWPCLSEDLNRDFPGPSPILLLRGCHDLLWCLQMVSMITPSKIHSAQNTVFTGSVPLFMALASQHWTHLFKHANISLDVKNGLFPFISEKSGVKGFSLWVKMALIFCMHLN